MPGIESEEHVEMILDRDAFSIEYDSNITSLDDMYEAILSLGYTPRLALDGVSEMKQLVPEGEVPEPIAAALTSARVEGKLVFVDFFAEWCIACKALEQQTLNNTDVQSALQNYIFTKVDTDLFPQSAVFYNVVGMPTLLVLDATGKEIFRSVGPIAAEELAEKLDSLSAVN
ncbi:MAG: thioredoxin family protein [Gammaproteobacteria bacterium]|nr:thioredoxin family protein [Gammaproteobacteria bacterium]